MIKQPAIGIPEYVKGVLPAVVATLARQWPHDLTPGERVQERRLYIAMMRDIAGLESDPAIDDVGKRLAAESNPKLREVLKWRLAQAADNRDPSVIRRDQREGRRMWANLGAWPWSLFGPKGEQADEWPHDRDAIEALRRWLG